MTTFAPYTIKNLLQFLEHTIETEQEVLNQMLDTREPWYKIFDQFRNIEDLYRAELHFKSML